MGLDRENSEGPVVPGLGVFASIVWIVHSTYFGYNTNLGMNHGSIARTPTAACYGDLTWLYAYYNGKLFANILPDCLITLQRHAQCYGYFRPQSFRYGKRVTDEIALNPEFFVEQRKGEIFQTLVHEMVHLWQEHLGKPGRRGYHNREWAAKMESIGLMPSSTGEQGGKKTGDKVGDYVITGGLFEKVTAEVQGRWEIWIHDLRGEEDAAAEDEHAAADERTKPTRRKYSCGCGRNVWGRPGLEIKCLACDAPFVMMAP